MGHGSHHVWCVVECHKSCIFANAFIHIFANEITMIGNIQWLSIHLYVVQA
jgi:hypothetical protein